MSKRAELIERLEAGSGADRELDADISIALHALPVDAPDWLRNNFTRLGRLHDGSPGQICVIHDNGLPGANWASAKLTSSLDACLALQNAVLPGWIRREVSWDSIAFWGVWLDDNQCPYTNETYGSHKSECRAWLIAILRAVEAKESEE